jgi:hypothetical protein
MFILVANSMPGFHVYILVYTVPSLEMRIATILSIFPVTHNTIYSIWARMCFYVRGLTATTFVCFRQRSFITRDSSCWMVVY